MNQIEFLLRLSENAQEKGDDIAKRHNDERASHVRDLLDLDKMINLAKQNVLAELARFGVSRPGQQPEQVGQRQEPVPRIVQKGPAAGAGG